MLYRAISIGIGSLKMGMKAKTSVKWMQEKGECLLVEAPLLRVVTLFDCRSCVVSLEGATVVLDVFEDLASVMSENNSTGNTRVQINWRGYIVPI